MANHCYDEKDRRPERHRPEVPRNADKLSNAEMLRLSRADAPAPLSPALREKFEPAFGADFSNIRVSRGYIPSELGIEAAVRGTSILLDRRAGPDVLGHELAHAVQQATGQVKSGGHPVVRDAGLERDADMRGASAAFGGAAEGGALMPIAPMSEASAPAMCKSKEEKAAEKEQKQQAEQEKQRQKELAEQAYKERDIDDAMSLRGKMLESGGSFDDDAFQAHMSKKYGGEFADIESASITRRDKARTMKELDEWKASGDPAYSDEKAAEQFSGMFGSELGDYKTQQAERSAAMAANPEKEKGGVGHWFSEKFRKMKDSHRRAYDQLADHEEDYRAMPWYKRAAWSAKNLGARIRFGTGNGKKDYAARKARKQELDKRLEAYRGGIMTEADRAAADRNASQGAVGGGKTDPGGTSTDYSKFVSAPAGITAPAIGMHGIGINDMRMEAPGISSEVAPGFTSASGVTAGIGQGIDMVRSFKTADKRRKMGDKSGTASAAFRGIGSLAMLGSSATKSAVPGINTGALDYVALDSMATAIPGLNAVGSGMNMVADAIDLGDATKRRSRMTDRRKALEEKGLENLSENDQLMYKIAGQGHKAAKADQLQAGLSMTGNALKTTGNIMTASGVASLPGTIIGGVGTAIGMGGSMMANIQRGDILRGEASDEMGVKERTRQVQLLYPDMSDEEAKRFVMQSLGFSSGTRMEAGQALTRDRAHQLKHLALSGDEDAIKMLEDLSVGQIEKNGKKTYSKRLIAERLAMKGNGSLKQQRQDTIDAFTNPFGRDAAAARAKTEQEEREKAEKEAKKRFEALKKQEKKGR